MSKFSAGKASILVLSAVFAVSAFLLGKSLTDVLAAPAGKVTICHAKPADTAANGWVSINVSMKAIVTGQSKHATEHDADIIPSFTFDYGTGPQFYAGKNWDATGQAIWNNGCKSPANPTPSPTFTPEPSGTPTPTCNPAEQQCETPSPIPSPTPFDACPNLEGIQETVPDGYDVDENDNCIPEPTPTPGDLCANIDGFQSEVPNDLHENAGNCIGFTPAGPPENGGGPSQGQVLGASTMAGTGSFTENLFMAIMGLGGTLATAGFALRKKATKLA